MARTKRTQIPAKVQTEVLLRSGRICCLCYGLKGDESVQPGQTAHLDGDPNNNALDNLAWMCLPHHDQYDGSTSQSKNFTEAEARSYRERLYSAVDKRRQESNHPQSRILKFPGLTDQSLVVQAIGEGSYAAGRDVNIVNVKLAKGGKRSDIGVLPGTVSQNPRMIGYLRYLIDRYNEFKAWDCERRGETMHYGFIYTAYKRELKYDAKHTPIELFDNGVRFLQHRIESTMLGRMRKQEGQRLYSSFDEFDT